MRQPSSHFIHRHLVLAIASREPGRKCPTMGVWSGGLATFIMAPPIPMANPEGLMRALGHEEGGNQVPLVQLLTLHQQQ